MQSSRAVHVSLRGSAPTSHSIAQKAAAAPHLSSRVHIEWKVAGLSRWVSCGPRMRSSRCTSSPAALRVKVMTSSDSGRAPAATSNATRAAMMRVLPLPGPARMAVCAGGGREAGMTSSVHQHSCGLSNKQSASSNCSCLRIAAAARLPLSSLIHTQCTQACA